MATHAKPILETHHLITEGTSCIRSRDCPCNPTEVTETNTTTGEPQMHYVHHGKQPFITRFMVAAATAGVGVAIIYFAVKIIAFFLN